MLFINTMTKSVLILSEMPLWNIQEGVGIRVLSETIKAFKKDNWNTITIYPGQDDLISKPNAKVMSIKVLGAIYMYLWRRVLTRNMLSVSKKILKKENGVNLIYAIGPTCHYIAHNLQKEYVDLKIVARHLGTWSMYSKMNSFFYRLKKATTLKKYNLPASLYIVTNDGSCADKVLIRLGVDEKRIISLKNGIDFSNFQKDINNELIRNELNISSDAFVCLSVTRLAKGKNVDLVLSIFIKVLREFNNSVLLIVGDGPEKKKLMRMVKEYNVKDNVRFIGAVSHDEIAKFYYISDLFLSFYNYSNAGNPLLEALITGKCILTFNNGATKDFLPIGYDLLIKEGDMEVAKHKIIELHNNRGLIQKYSSEVKSFAKTLITSWDKRMELEMSEINILFDLNSYK